MQNGRILILIVLDKKIYILLGHLQPSYYALDSIEILYRYYANINANVILSIGLAVDNMYLSQY